MTADDGKKRAAPPDNPSGFPLADEGPAFVAPAVDVRPRAREQIPAKPVDGPSSEVTVPGEVPFWLSVPVEEKTVERQYTDPESERTLDEASPLTVDYERNIPTLLAHAKAEDYERAPRPPPDPVKRTPSSRPPSWEGDTDDADHMSQRDALVLDLAAIGPVDERPDRDVERSVSARAALARARALRFRLSLHDVWPAGQTPRFASATVQRKLHIDLSLDCALLAAIADGAPMVGAAAYPFVGRLAALMLAHRPDLPRTALRDRGASSIARLTIVGWGAALENVGKAAGALPIDSRRLALEMAAAVVLVGAVSSHRLGALGDLELALSLPTGSSAAALDLAR